MGLQQFEQRLERLVEGAFAKAFRGELQPIELGRRLTREMDLRRAVSVRGLIAPNVFEVGLSEEDFDRFGGFVDVLSQELVEAAREHARAEGYAFLGPVQVRIAPVEELSRSTFTIDGDVVEGEATPGAYLVLPDGRRLGLVEEAVTIGRLPDCAVQLNDPNVSRRHAQVRRQGEAFMVVDLGSTNGTKVNGIPIRQHRLIDGDALSIGMSTLRFEMA